MDESDERTQGIRDIATALPFLTIVLLTSPLIVVYLFSAWIVIVALAFLVARRLERAERAEAEREDGSADR